MPQRGFEDVSSEEEDVPRALKSQRDHKNTHSLARRIVCGGLIVMSVFLAISHHITSANRSPNLKLATWNVAAINNNPFEYWITHDDPAYNKLMADVQEFVDSPGDDRDVPVKLVFTPSMFDQLKQCMMAQGWTVTETERVWVNDFSNRRIVSGFLKDESIGEKRLASMPDRYTNTIRLENGQVSCRPTVINCYDGDLSNIEKWWDQWRRFMFDQNLEVGRGPKRPSELLKPIKHAKYPAISEAEEAYSLPLQTLSQAIFDAILVHVVNTVSPDGRWQTLRNEMCDALNRKKDVRTLDILKASYYESDVIFLQETAISFQSKLKSSSLGSKFSIISPASRDTSRDQNSIILLNRHRFVINSVVEHTDKVLALFSGKRVPVAPGDLIVISVQDILLRKFILASFHGDTNGLATKPVFEAVSKFAAQNLSGHMLLFGMDANTYEKQEPGKQFVLDFATSIHSKGYTSCWGDMPNPKNYTTYNARTYLQPQLQKAAKESERAIKGDLNPKDFIVFPGRAFQVVSTTKDNTGKREYVEQMVFPTLQFPSDHGVLSTELTPTLTHS